MQAISINGQVRDGLGKKTAKTARQEGQIPAVIYGGQEPIHFTTTLNEVRNIIYTGDFKVAEVAVNGDVYRCILKDVQFHPIHDTVMHIDFLRLAEGQTVKVDVPLRFVGNSPGVRAGGKLLQNVRRIKIKTTPEHLVDELTLDISELELGQSVRVRNITPPEGVEIMVSPGVPVATIEIPRALRSATAAAEKAAGKK